MTVKSASITRLVVQASEHTHVSPMTAPESRGSENVVRCMVIGLAHFFFQ